ncbi:MAG TPA: thymidine kinase [Candidatus Limnocylindria bacterium]|nr:thymidine kinase [Candidatus Limnocylindria bacterium]
MSIPDNKKRDGSLEVICGPMFSGKSEELIRRLRRAKIARQTVLVFKNSLDNQRTQAFEFVVSHDGNKLNAQPITQVEKILSLALHIDADVIGIDEVQFFPYSILPIICKLLEAKKRIIVAGLDLDFRGVPFGPMPTLLAIADKITKLQAICTVCGSDAPFTQRLVNNYPARYDDPVILVGAQESYQARCRTCYSIDKRHTFTHEQTHNIL